MDSWTPCLEFRLSKGEVGPRDVHFGECPRWCLDPSPFGPSTGLTKLTHTHANRFKTLPLCLLQCQLMASHKNTIKLVFFCRWHSAGFCLVGRLQRRRGLSIFLSVEGLTNIWCHRLEMALPDKHIEAACVWAACYLPRWSRLEGQGESTPFRKMRGQ